jgi:hypothetical protein
MSDHPLSSFRSFPSSSQSVAEECLEVVRGYLQKNQIDEKRTPRLNEEGPPEAHTQPGYDRNDRNDQSQQARRERIAAALLDDFALHGDVHEVRVPGVDKTQFIVATVADVNRLAGEGITRGRIWTARELADLLRSSATAQDFAAVALAKLALDGDVVAVRSRAEVGQ